MGINGILVNLIAYPVRVLGYGERAAIWTQGCTLACKGCMSEHTWDFDRSKEMSIDDIVDQLTGYDTKKITISGGEPFEQKNLHRLLQKLRVNGFDDILVYTGLSESVVRKSFPHCLEYIDVLISEPFVSGLESELSYKGSDNQKMIILNDSLRFNYENYAKKTKDKKLQKFGNFIVGIPYQKDVEAIL